jgi:hypothetical protein
MSVPGRGGVGGGGRGFDRGRGGIGNRGRFFSPPSNFPPRRDPGKSLVYTSSLVATLYLDMVFANFTCVGLATIRIT